VYIDVFSEHLFSNNSFMFSTALVTESIQLLESLSVAVTFEMVVDDPALDAQIAPRLVRLNVID
jgi:hypothetical protein